MRIEIKSELFDPWTEIQQHQEVMQAKGKYGAIASFVGSMRDFNEGDRVHGMTLEHYPGMTESHLVQIAETAHERWDLVDSLIIHRIGDIGIGDPIVLIAVWSVHRVEAFDACRFIMEDLKSKAPFWKQETLEGGKRWVEKNTPG
jgi:molybdopterin synthase catalytic subunit